MLNRTFLGVFAAALLSANTTSFANEDRVYDVEVIVFAHKSNQYYSSEKWQSDEPTYYEAPQNLADFGTSSYPNNFKKRSLASDETNEIIEDIKSSSRYDLITFQRWQQPGLPKDKAIPVKLSSDVVFEYPAQTETTDTELESPHQTEINEQIIAESHQLDGHITIELGRFLHIYTDLVYSSPIKKTIEKIPYTIPTVPSSIDNVDELETAEPLYTEIMNSELAFPSQFEMVASDDSVKRISLNSPYTIEQFSMQTHRKTRSKQFQYIDHPLFGVIVKITPVVS